MNLLFFWSGVINTGGGGKVGGAAMGPDWQSTASSSSAKGCMECSWGPLSSPPGDSVDLRREKRRESRDWLPSSYPGVDPSVQLCISELGVFSFSLSRIGVSSFSLDRRLLAHVLVSLNRSPSVLDLRKLRRPLSSLLKQNAFNCRKAKIFRLRLFSFDFYYWQLTIHLPMIR